jgi:hypothetical protein
MLAISYQRAASQLSSFQALISWISLRFLSFRLVREVWLFAAILLSWALCKVIYFFKSVPLYVPLYGFVKMGARKVLGHYYRKQP